jgi:hypothetical protein
MMLVVAILAVVVVLAATIFAGFAGLPIALGLLALVGGGVVVVQLYRKERVGPPP